MADVVQIDKTIVEWMLAAGGALLLFFLGLGVKDIRDKMAKVDKLCLELERIKSKVEYLEKVADCVDHTDH